MSCTEAKILERGRLMKKKEENRERTIKQITHLGSWILRGRGLVRRRALLRWLIVAGAINQVSLTARTRD